MTTDEHPGQMIARVLRAAGISVEKAAIRLEVDGANLCATLNGRRGIGPLMALRLESAFSIDAGYIVCAQARHDLHKYRQTIAG